MKKRPGIQRGQFGENNNHIGKVAGAPSANNSLNARPIPSPEITNPNKRGIDHRLRPRPG
jgi:hypothetical protein